MLACADKNGEVQASIPGLARIAGVPVEACREAINKFLSPDPDSRTKDDEGRRIEEIDGGWSLLNFRKYREMASKEDSKASEAARKARYRAKIARNAKKCPENVPPVSTVNPHIADTDSDEDSEAETGKEEKSKESAKMQESEEIYPFLSTVSENNEASLPGKEAALLQIWDNPNAPTKEELEAYIEEAQLDFLVNSRPKIYEELLRDKFHLWRNGEWQPIRNWKKCLTGLNATIEKA